MLPETEQWFFKKQMQYGRPLLGVPKNTYICLLRDAINDGQVEAAHYLLSKGARLTHEHLRLATIKGQPEILQALLKVKPPEHQERLLELAQAASPIALAPPVKPMSIETQQWLFKKQIQYGSLLAGVPKNKYFDVFKDAITDNQIETVVYLLDSDVEAKEEGGLYLHFAATQGNVAIVKILLQSGTTIDASRDTLHHVAKSGNLEMMRVLATTDSVNARTSNFCTPLHYASSFAMVEFLLALGADVKAGDGSGFTVIHWAVKNDLLDFVRLIIDKKWDDVNRPAKPVFGGHKKPLHLVSSFAVAHCLIEAGASITDVDEYGNTVLSQAIEINNLELVDYLLKMRLLDIDAKNKRGKTALHQTVENHLGTKPKIDIVRRLLAEKLEVNAKDNEGNSAAHLAAAAGHIEVLQILKEAGADLNCVNHKGDTPLHCIQLFNIDLNTAVLAIKSLNLNIHALNYEQKTPLHTCVARTDNDANNTMSILIAAGANMNAADHEGNPPLHIAARQSKLVVALNCLLKHGALVHVMNKHQKKPIDLMPEYYPNGREKLLGAMKVQTPRVPVAVVNWTADFSQSAEMRLIEQHTLALTQGIPIRMPHKNKKTGESVMPSVEEFLNAAKNGTIQVVIQCLAENIDINVVDEHGCTALHLASESGNIAVVEQLIKAKAKLDFKNHAGKSALHLASENNHEGVVTQLIDASANVNAVVNGGPTALHLAAIKGHAAIVKQLINAGANLNFKYSTCNNKTALHFAVETNHEAVVAQLLAAKANMQLADRDGCAALHLAAKTGNVAVARQLIVAGAPLNAKDLGKKSALHFAVENHHQAMVALLIEVGININLEDRSRKTALHWAAETGDSAAVAQLIAAQALLNAANVIEMSAIHFAAENNHDAIITQLATAGAQVNLVDKYGRTALYLAAGKGNTEAIRALLSVHADRGIKNLNGWTPLHLAVDRRYPEVVELLAAPTTVNAVNRIGWTPLHLAVYNNNPEIAAHLIAAQADVTIITQDGQSMLDMAVIKGNTTLVALLLAAKADVNVKDSNGQTALHCAVIKGDTAVVAQLIAAKPDMTIVDNNGYSAFNFATHNGHKEIAEQLITAKEFFTLSENARFLRSVLTVNLVVQLCFIPERMLNYAGLLDTVLSKKDFVAYLKTEQCQKDLALYKTDVKHFMQKPMEYLMIQLDGFFKELYIAASYQPTEIFQDPQNVHRDAVAQAACDSTAQLRNGKTQEQIDYAYNAFYAYFASIEFEADLQAISRYPFGEGLISTYTKQATPEQRMTLLKRAILGDAGSLGYIARMLTPDVPVEVATQFKNTAGLVWLAIQDVEHLESVKYLKEFAEFENIAIPPEQIEEALQEARFTLWKGMVKIQYEHLETLEVSRTYPASKGSVHLHHLSIIDGLVDHAGISASMCKEIETQEEVRLTAPAPTYLTTGPAATQPPQTVGLSSSSVPQMDSITPS